MIFQQFYWIHRLHENRHFLSRSVELGVMAFKWYYIVFPFLELEPDYQILFRVIFRTHG